jgi:hypothetical protein
MLRKGQARRFAVGMAGALLTLCCATSAHAATASWTCGANAVTATVAGLDPVNPVTASRTPCADQSTGLPNLTDSLGLAPTINAKSAYAITAARPTPAKPIEQAVGAAAGVEGLSIKSGDMIVLGVDAAKSEASAVCKNGAPVFTGSTDIVGLTLGGQKISLDQPLITLTDGLSQALGALVEIKLNEIVKDSNGYIIRAAHIKVLKAMGASPLLDVVVAESRLSSASACDPNADGNTGSGTGGSGTGTGTGGSSTLQLCPTGSVLDAAKGMCVIPASASGGQGVIVIGPPYSGPSGGTVLSLTIARQRYKSLCLQGSGPKYAIVGTNKANRITGTNGPDRMLGLGGNDALDGGRGNDCLDGGTGGDTLSGALGNDREYGLTGNDHLNGGPGNDYLSAGAGNDTINTSFGRDTVVGGSGVDFINSATAGSPAKINCGAGRDKVRINRNERKRLTGCEVVYVFKDK